MPPDTPQTPKTPAYVAEYDVKKVNNFKRRQDRILRVTEEGVYNLKRNNVVRRFHPFEDIKNVILVDTQRFTVQFYNWHDYNYICEMAVHIVRELRERIQANMSDVRMRDMYSRAIEYQVEQMEMEGGQASMVIGADVLDPAHFTGTPERPQARELEMPEDVREVLQRRRKLEQILGTSEEDRIGLDVDQIVFDQTGDLGHTIQCYVKAFTLGASFSETVASLRNFLETVKRHVLTKTDHEALTRHQMVPEPGAMSTEPAPDVAAVSVASVVEGSLFAALVHPLAPMLGGQLLGELDAEDVAMARLCGSLARVPQTGFGIPEDAVSRTGFPLAIAALKQLDDVLPSLDPAGLRGVILDTADSIYKAAAAEGLGTIGAEEFLPILMFVIARAGLARAVSGFRAVSEFLSDGDRVGEIGYYSTVFRTALDGLKMIRVEDVG